MSNRVELCYLWIDEYKLFEDVGINFSNRQFIRYDFKNNILDIEENSSFINNFFKNNISNITALVGKNGSGKTMLLKYIQNSLLPTFHKNIIVYRKGNILHILYNQYGKKPHVKLDKELKLQIEYHELGNKAKNSVILYKLYKELGLINIAYFSSNYFCSIESLKTPYRISNNILIENSVFYPRIMSYSRENYTNAKQYSKEVMSIINFISNKKQEIQKMTNGHISHLQIIPKLNYNNKLTRLNSANLSEFFIDQNFHSGVEKKIVDRNVKFRDSLINSLINLLENVKEQNSEEKHSLYFKLITLINMVMDFYISLYNSHGLIRKINVDLYKLMDFRKIVKDNFGTNQMIDFIKMFFQGIIRNYKVVGKLIEASSNEHNPYKRIVLEKVILKVEGYIELLGNLNLFDDKWIVSPNYKLILETNKENFTVLKKLLEYGEDFNNDIFYEFKWIKNDNGKMLYLSSGEEELLKIYAKLYRDLNEYANSGRWNVNKVDESVIILLDEPEVYFHPKWQIRLVKLLLNFFNIIYEGITVQIILSSNSPFLLSDLPKENVVLLKKENNIENGQIRSVIDLQSIPNTFAQNIHKLLKEVLFMEFTMGDFAKEEVNNIIKILTSEVKEDDKKFINQKDIIFTKINMIGEKLIKNHLLNLYYEKVIKSEYISKEQKIKNIDLEIKKLEMLKKKMNMSQESGELYSD
ncbi:AAA family ATPase [Bacillus cereus]|nr:AAA family ATPase [Bacillus cereus]